MKCRSIELEARAMATNLTLEIAAKVSLLPPERQREALSLIEQLAARATPRASPLPRAERKLKGATAQGRSISSEEILESRREMWGEYMREDET
jgi:hypothetical protein